MGIRSNKWTAMHPYSCLSPKLIFHCIWLHQSNKNKGIPLAVSTQQIKSPGLKTHTYTLTHYWAQFTLSGPSGAAHASSAVSASRNCARCEAGRLMMEESTKSSDTAAPLLLAACSNAAPNKLPKPAPKIRIQILQYVESVWVLFPILDCRV